MFLIFIRDRRAPRRPRRQVRGDSRPVSGHRGRTPRPNTAAEHRGRAERTGLNRDCRDPIGATGTLFKAAGTLIEAAGQSNRDTLQGGRQNTVLAFR